MAVKKKDISVEIVPHSGMIVLSAIINGYSETRKYLDYTVKEAKNAFVNEFNTQKVQK